MMHNDAKKIVEVLDKKILVECQYPVLKVKFLLRSMTSQFPHFKETLWACSPDTIRNGEKLQELKQALCKDIASYQIHCIQSCWKRYLFKIRCQRRHRRPNLF